MYLQKKILIFLLSIFTLACTSMEVAASKVNKTQQRPNILWIYVEDISPHLGSYGEELVSTPTLDALAHQGTRFENAIAPAPVCSAMRSAMMTGQMHTNLGVHNHHSSRTPESAIHLPEGVRTVPEIMKEHGYFTFNSGKDDYNFVYDRFDLYSGDYKVHPLYGKSGVAIDWNAREDKSQPFFGQIQLKGGKHIFNSRFAEKVEKPIDRSKIDLPPYYPEHPVVVEEWARYLESIQITDREVKDIIRRLDEDGELENTVIFFFADHGMRFLRHKQFLYDGGLRVPFIAYWQGRPDLIPPKVVEDQISLLDISATTLALGEVKIPTYFEGENLFADDYKSPEYIISARDRCDFTIDRIRSVRSDRYKYIKNFYPQRSGMQPSYRDYWELTKVMRELYENNELSPIQARHFLPERPDEELYDLNNDPHEINNLASSEDYSEVLQEYRRILEKWIVQSDDQGQYPEDQAALELMLGIWGELAVNPEYDALRKQCPKLAGSLEELRTAEFKLIEDSK